MRPTMDPEEALATAVLLSPLRERPLAVEPPEMVEARMRRIVPRLEAYTSELVAKRRRRTSWSRMAWLAAALSAGVGAGVLYGRSGDGDVNTVTVSGDLVEIDAAEERTKLRGSLRVSPLGRVEAGESGAQISTREGLELELGPLASAGIGQLGGGRLAQRVRLDSGSIRCSVPKLAGGREFSVSTPDALVVVHGTRFSVEVEPMEDGLSQTCVRVTEGRVAVHGAGSVVLLGAGDEHGCGDLAASAVAPKLPTVSEKVVTSTSAKPRKAADVGIAKANAAKEQGTLGRETELLQSALRAEQAGDIEGARRQLQQLLQRYPDSPLSDEASSMLRRVMVSPTESRARARATEPRSRD
jgi:hypothetical protein